MVLIRWLGKLLSLPLEWCGRLLLMFNSSLGLSLLHGAWWLGGSPELAVIILSRLLKDGRKELAQQKALQFTRRHPEADVAAYVGMMANDEGNVEAAGQWLEFSRTLKPSRTGLPELLEYAIAERDPDPFATARLGQALLGRRNLHMMLSRKIHDELLWMDLLQGRFDQARQRARFMREVEENPLVELAQWTLAMKDGRPDRAAVHLARAAAPPNVLLCYRAYGAHALGDFAQRDQYILQLEEMDASLAQRARQFLGQLEGAV